MSRIRLLPAHLDLAERADFYGVCQRTIRRWHKAGADVHSAAAVAEFLVRQRGSKPHILKNILRKIEL